jgi:hypothetical protein
MPAGGAAALAARLKMREMRPHSEKQAGLAQPMSQTTRGTQDQSRPFKFGARAS